MGALCGPPDAVPKAVPKPTLAVLSRAVVGADRGRCLIKLHGRNCSKNIYQHKEHFAFSYFKSIPNQVMWYKTNVHHTSHLAQRKQQLVKKEEKKKKTDTHTVDSSYLLHSSVANTQDSHAVYSSSNGR